MHINIDKPTGYSRHGTGDLILFLLLADQDENT